MAKAKAALNEREAARIGPRQLKDPQSVEFAWQTVALLKTYYQSKQVTEGRWRKALAEAEQHRIYERVPPESPYGSLDAMLTAEIGETAASSTEKIRALDAEDKAALRGPGNPTGANQYGKPENGNFDNIKDSTLAPTGTSKQYALRRLRKSRPDLHARVLAGELTCHAAMLEAGFRRELTPAEECQRAWDKMTAQEQRAFFARNRPRDG
jgi:hypothetical protein